MDDNKIIELYWKRDENAVSQTKERYGNRLKALAYRILNSSEDAEECENDTYLKTWETIPPKKPQYFFAYLAKICRNTALHILEKAKAEKRNVIVTELTNELSECLPDKKSIEEAAEYFRIGENKLRNMINSNKLADYILWNGNRAQIKRRLFEKHIDQLSFI